MKFPLYSRVALAIDVPADGIRRGDLATVVEYHASPASGMEAGYSVEVFNAVGGTVAVLTVSESHLEVLRSDEVLSVRARTTAA